jgi:hypothetical protein
MPKWAILDGASVGHSVVAAPAIKAEVSGVEQQGTFSI